MIDYETEAKKILSISYNIAPGDHDKCANSPIGHAIFITRGYCPVTTCNIL